MAIVSHIIELLQLFYILTQQCSRNNTLLSNVFPNAEILKKFFSNKANSQPGRCCSTTLEILAENKKELSKESFIL